ncbi:MAG: glycerophosphodiester phosphodiesterase [Spiroplasma sp.]
MAILVAHRGFRSLKAENLMINFVEALKTCSAIEFDIRMTKDKKIIIFHDHNFKRIGQTNKTVKSLTYQEIKQINFFKKNPEFLPPLFIEDFANKLARQYQMINVEIKPNYYTKKEFFILEKALKELKKKTQAEIIVSSFSLKTLKFIANLNSKLFKKGYLIKNLKKIDNNLIKKFDYLHPYLGTIKQKRNIQVINKINLPMNIWTFKNNTDVKTINTLYHKKLIYSYISDIPNLEITQ